MLRLSLLLLVALLAQAVICQLQVVDAGETLQIRAKRSEPVVGEGSGEGSGHVEGSGETIVQQEGSGEGSGAEPLVSNTTANVEKTASDDSLLTNILAKEKKTDDEIAA